MEINFTNVNFEKDIILPENIQTLNNDIKKICNELPALNIVKDVSLLDYTIEQTEKFKRNKKRLVDAVDEVSTCAISGAVGTFANINPNVEKHVAKN